MNETPATIPAPRRRIWPWVLGICLTPFVLLGITIASVLTLDRDAATLRRHVMAATDSSWDTKIQFSVGSLLFSAVRTGLLFVHEKGVDDARLALAAVKHASVGIYELQDRHADWSREQLFVQTDRAMQKRGWSRLAGIVDHNDTVLVYISDDLDPDDDVEICIAVVSGKELVVASTRLDPASLMRLVEKHAVGDLRHSLRLAKF